MLSRRPLNVRLANHTEDLFIILATWIGVLGEERFAKIVSLKSPMRLASDFIGTQVDCRDYTEAIGTIVDEIIADKPVPVNYWELTMDCEGRIVIHIGRYPEVGKFIVFPSGKTISGRASELVNEEIIRTTQIAAVV